MSKITPRYCFAAIVSSIVFPLTAHSSLTDLNIEDLMQVEVYSVGKKEQSGNKVAAAVYVITDEDIKHAGVRSIPEALRLAPGVSVSSIDSNKWSVGIRGGVGRFSNKLLVMIDGRTIYTPVFSGVYWEHHGLVLDDIKQIEVIRGPGATIWGANAVNGVINIITKSAHDTHGVLLNAGTGNIEKGFVDLRYGGKITDALSYKIFGKAFERDDFKTLEDNPAGDHWKHEQAGFRVDWAGDDKSLMISGDAFDSDNHSIERFALPISPYSADLQNTIDAGGWNILAKWDDTINENHQYSIQIFYDTYHRAELIAGQKVKTMDIDTVYNYKLNEKHQFTFGLGARRQSGILEDRLFTMTVRPEKNLHLYSGFIQDDIKLSEQTNLIVGTKIEHNDFTGYELQPSVRFVWARSNGHVWWASIAKAVRTPNRIERSSSILVSTTPPAPPFFLTGLGTFQGVESYNSEELIAYETGYRFSPMDNLFVDISAFYNDYDDIRTVEQQPVVIDLAARTASVQAIMANGIFGSTKGFEIFTHYQPLDWMDMKLSYSYLKQDYEVRDWSNYVGFVQLENDTPENIVTFLTKLKPRHDFDFDIWLRYVDDIGWSGLSSEFGRPIPGYFTMDLQAIYRPMEHIELSLVGQNLLNHDRLESIQLINSNPTKVPKSIYGKISLTF